jgi:hypothetical protein
MHANARRQNRVLRIAFGGHRYRKERPFCRRVRRGDIYPKFVAVPYDSYEKRGRSQNEDYVSE